MITKDQYDKAIETEKECRETINQYHRERHKVFQQRLKDNPIFTDEELFYSRTQLCPCGHGLAYPRTCGPHHYWDCSAILKGIADDKVEHTGQLPFAFYSVKGELEGHGTTRGVFLPQVKDASND